MKIQLKATIDNIAFVALVFAVVAISAVSLVAVVSAENLIATNEKILRAQRVVSSFESIRFNVLVMDIGEQNYIISGSELDLGRFQAAAVEIEGNLSFLRERPGEHAAMENRFAELDRDARELIVSERQNVETRKTQGFAAAPPLARNRLTERKQEKLISVTRQLLSHSRQVQVNLEADQIVYGDKVRRLILALISSSAFILIFLYGTLRRLNREQHAAQVRIAYQAMHDSLTDLFNRPAVMEHISTRLRDADTEVALGGFALLLMDLDGFKAVNDSFGHDAGDALLKEVAQRTRQELRDSDYIARLGGDEFLIVVPQVSDRATAARVAAKLNTALEKEYQLGGNRAQISASIGISLFPGDARDLEDLMKCADVALYRAKKAGKNRAHFFEPEMRGKS